MRLLLSVTTLTLVVSTNCIPLLASANPAQEGNDDGLASKNASQKIAAPLKANLSEDKSIELVGATGKGELANVGWTPGGLPIEKRIASP